MFTKQMPQFCPNCDCKEKHNLPFGQCCCRGVSPPSPSVHRTRSLNRRFGYCPSDLSLSNLYPCHSLYDSQISVVPVVRFKRFTGKNGNFIRQSIIKIGGGVCIPGKLYLTSTISHFADVEPAPGPKMVK